MERSRTFFTRKIKNAKINFRTIAFNSTLPPNYKFVFNRICNISLLIHKKQIMLPGGVSTEPSNIGRWSNTIAANAVFVF